MKYVCGGDLREGNVRLLKLFFCNAVLGNKTFIARNNWDKVFKNGPRKIFGRQHLKFF